MNYNLDVKEINLILQGLNLLPHGEVRNLIDKLVDLYNKEKSVNKDKTDEVQP